MRLKIILLAYYFFAGTSCSYAQFENSSAGSTSATDSARLQSSDSRIAFTEYFKLLKDDFIRQASSPFQMSKQDLIKAGGFTLVTAGVMKLDKSINRTAQKLYEKNSTLRTVSPQVTKFGGRYALYTMVGIGSLGFIFKDHRLSNATLLATQSYLTSGIWVSAIKFITGRERPSYYDPQTNESNGAWHGPFFQFKKTANGTKPDGAQFSSFPSGHAAAAFSIATVYAEMYKDKPLVPVLAYTGASLIGLSRIIQTRHWTSDVLVSAVLGYLCGKQVVSNFHKLERLNAATHKKKNMLTYNINFINNTVMPELIYTFR